MPDQNKVIEELDFLTDVLSNRVRTTAAGVLAFCLGFIVEGSQSVTGGFLSAREVAPPIALSLLALLSDLLQYVFGYILNMRMLRALSLADGGSLAYDRGALSYRARHYCFYLKIVCALAAAQWLIVLLIVHVGALS